MRKRLLSFLLLLAIISSFVACGKKNGGTKSENGDPVGKTQVGTDGQNGDPTKDGRDVRDGNVTPTPSVVAQPEDELGTPGEDFQMLEAGSIQGWDEETPAPFFNPLGDRALYSDASVRDSAKQNSYVGLEITYIDTDGITPVTFTVYGQEYTLQIDHPDMTRNWLIYMAKQQGADIYKTDLSSVVFSLQENEATLWWCLAKFEAMDQTSVTIHMVRVNTLKSGNTMTIRTSDEVFDEVDQSYHFYTKCQPGKQQMLTVSFEDTWEDEKVGFYLEASKDIRYGETHYYVKKYLDDTVICSRKGQTIVYDDIPVVDGWLEWKLSHNASGEETRTITLSITETEDIHKVTWGEGLGLVRIVGAPEGGGAYVEMTNGSFDHPEVPLEALKNFYRDEDGNYCLAVPAGYYTLNVAEDAISAITNSGRIQNLPVSAGQITEVTIPKELQATFSDVIARYRSSDSEAGGIVLPSVTDNGATAVIEMTVFDPLERDIYPEVSDFHITENGLAGTVTEVLQVPGKADVILCMDSSGSMRKSMKDALDAAKRFVESLPENSTISVIQFEQNITEHKGNTKEEAIAALNKIKADGGTSLYDAVATALLRLENSERPYVVVFSDGADSREPGVDGTGSSISREEICVKIKESKATVLTIGFGAGHDPKALMEMRDASKGGAYFVAADKNALDAAFNAVTAKFGNQFIVTYQRPDAKKDTDSDIPVVSMMMDVSDSMNLNPKEYPDDDVDYRIDRIKSIFHDFVMDLPNGTLMQFNSFCQPPMASPRVIYEQMTTKDKASILRAIGSVTTTGGTPIVEALQTSLDELLPIASTKKVLVFFTDCALEVWDDGSGAQRLEFEETLKKLKNSSIRVLFAGLGGEEYAKAQESTFKKAAELAGGDYIITSSVEAIAMKLQELQSRVNTPIEKDNQTVSLMVDLSCKTEDGSHMRYTASKELTDFSTREVVGEAVVPQTVLVRLAGPFIRYDQAGSSLLYGSDTPREDSIIENRVAFTGAQASNRFAKITVKEAYFLTKFRGLEKYGSMFIALNLELTYQKTDASLSETGYQIPSIFDHFYVSFNNTRMMPASEVTWLSEQPFTDPGDPSIAVMQRKDAKGDVLPVGETRTGIVIFEVDKTYNEDVKQLSFHSYDVTYGHMEIPLMGAMPERLLELSSLPKEEPKKISNAFSMQLTGIRDIDKLEGTDVNENSRPLSRAPSVFRVLEAKFLSNVQALLRIVPSERFYYKITTNSGDLLARMSPIVGNLPLGFTGDTMFAPASSNTVRIPYVIPEKLQTARAELWGELANGTFEISVQRGEQYHTGSDQTSFEHEYFSFTINDLAVMEKDSKSIVLDFTVTDKKDGEGTGGFDGMLMLKADTSELDFSIDSEQTSSGMTILNAVKSKGLGDFGDSTEVYAPLGLLEPDLEATRGLVFGASYADMEWGAYDGQSRRGILIFTLQSEASVDAWRLVSNQLPGMEVKISKTPYQAKELLAMLPSVLIDDDYEKAKEKAVSAAIEDFASTRTNMENGKECGLTEDEIIGDHVAAPMLTAYGRSVIESVRTIQDFYKVMGELEYLPDGKSDILYSPQSVLTQGFGSDAEFCELAKTLLARLGYEPRLRNFLITDAGRDNLTRLCGWKECELTEVRALAYTDENGQPHVYVPAFRREAQELYGLGELSFKEKHNYYESRGTIIVTASGKLTGDAGAAAQSLLMSDMGGFLIGSEEGNELYETIPLLEADFFLSEVGEDFVDVSFVAVGKSADGVHDIVTAVADSNAGLMTSPNNWVDTMNYDIDRITITISNQYVPSEHSTHTILLEEGEKLTDVFQSLALGAPELTIDAAKHYERLVETHANKGKDTAYGTARWLTHATLTRLVFALQSADEELCEKLSVKTGRTRQVLALAATLRSDGSDARASVDLMNIGNTVYMTNDSEDRGYEEETIKKAYHAMLGLFASQAEASALPDGQGKSYLDVFASLPEDTGFINVDCSRSEQENAAIALSEAGFPRFLIERLQEGNEEIGFLIPTKPGNINGEEHFAWLEINTNTGEIISVFDTGERSGMAGFVLGLTPKSSVEFTVGALVGVACSHFSVAGYTLRLVDYDDVMKCAENLMIFVYERLKQVQSGMDETKAWAKDPVGKAKDVLNEATKERTGVDVKELYEKYKGDAGDDEDPPEPTFVDGFKAIMEAYFGVSLE